MSAAETRAWKTAKPVVEDTDAESWALLEWWYSLPTDQAPYRKTDFAALLNNWHAEIAKAQRNKTSATPGKSSYMEAFDNPPSKQSFPWQSVADLPPDLLKKLAAVYPDIDDQADVFSTIKGRAIDFNKGGHSLDEWSAVFFSGIVREDQADSHVKGRATFAEGNHGRRKTGAAKVNRYEPRLTYVEDITDGGPENWQAHVDKHLPGSHATGGVSFGPWRNKSLNEQEAIRKSIVDHQNHTGTDDDRPF